jgi:dihydrofolate synthase/folylpolyglutamate synthase
MKLRTFNQAEQFLALHIPKSSQQTFSGELGLKRTKYFLHLLGRPQEKLKIIHVAGTSGKGSTCYLISSLLTSHGFKVGFHQSPHLTDVRERFQINNQIISKKEFIFYLNKIIPIINIVGRTFYGPLTYFEILVGLAYFIFYDKKVDYAVMETGLGGWYDGTNVVSRADKLAVLTKIGLDHTNILGKTLSEIAFQKAMIINKNSQVISINQATAAKKIIEQVAKKKQAKVLFIEKNHHFNFKLNLIGDYQKENAGLALATVNFLGQRDGFIIHQENVKKVFKKAHFHGRFDIKKIKRKTVVFDGAHNPQKMEAFIKALIQKYPNKKFNFLLAFKSGKDYRNMLKTIIPWADSIVLTSFFTENQDMINLSENPGIVGQQLKKIGFDNFVVIPSNKKALEKILTKKEPIVVTGSLYLVGEIYRLIKNN